jgi:hypothetical protein
LAGLSKPAVADIAESVIAEVSHWDGLAEQARVDEAESKIIKRCVQPSKFFFEIRLSVLECW